MPPALLENSFVQPVEHRPSVKFNEFEEKLPSIDFSLLYAGDESQTQNVIRAVGKACEEWGFFQVTGHRVPLELLENLREKSLRFFQQPLEEKCKVRRDARNAFGYFEGELTKNCRDWKEVFDVTRKRFKNLSDDHPENQTVDGWNQYPSKPEGFREAVEAYYVATEKLAHEILGVISLSLGLPRTYFFKIFEDHSSAFRLNYYPECPDPSLALGVGRHKDSGMLTVLYQDEVGGLQVRRKNGQWVGVKPTPGAYVINVGDMFQVFTNDRFESVEHRVVVNENKPRLSFPFFFNPSYDTMYSPVPELLQADEKPKYRPISWGEFSKKRNDGNFADLGEEVQIHHYKIS